MLPYSPVIRMCLVLAGLASSAAFVVPNGGLPRQLLGSPQLGLVERNPVASSASGKLMSRRVVKISPPSPRGGALQLAAVGLGPMIAAATLPTCLGFWKSEYTVSYAYGMATCVAGAMVLASGVPTIAAALHSACILIYGLRLGLFLLYRELNIEKFQKFTDKIEERAVERGSRLTRTPFVLGCSFLYLGLAAPLMVTSATTTLGGALPSFLLSTMYSGWGIAAFGDLWKTMVKAKEGADTLVTTGPFALLRHPNYTGEMIMWNSIFLLAVLAAASAGSVLVSAGWLAVALLGNIGINFVLMQATRGLETRQAEVYGVESSKSFSQYQQWVSQTWMGPALPPKETAATSSEQTVEDSPAGKE